jgi:hypothetical protein
MMALPFYRDDDWPGAFLSEMVVIEEMCQHDK